MAFRMKYKKPHRGDKVWLSSRITVGLQPNGKIVSVSYDVKEVLVAFEDNPRRPTVSMEFDELEFNWTDSLGGTYLIEEV